jgi:hypothetical protein
MRDNEVRNEGRLPKLVVDAIEAFVDDLHGRSSTFDLDKLDDDTRAIVEELLPDVAAVVLSGGGAPLEDVRGWEESRAYGSLGLVPVPGMVRLNGAAVRRHRDQLGLSAAEVAALVTGAGHTVMPSFVDDVEGRPGTPVAPAVAILVADALRVDVGDVTFDDSVTDGASSPTPMGSDAIVAAGCVQRAGASPAMSPSLGLADERVEQLVTSIRFARPDLKIELGASPTGGRPPLAALQVGRFGLTTVVLLFDVLDPAALWDRDVLDAAGAAFGSQPETLLVFLVAADDEHSTQPVDTDDLSAAVVTTSGQRLVVPRRAILGIGDAVRAAFEEILPTWDDIQIPVATTPTIDVAVIAAQNAGAALAAAVGARVRIPAKTKAFEVIAANQSLHARSIADAVTAVRNHELDPTGVADLVLAELAVAS